MATAKSDPPLIVFDTETTSDVVPEVPVPPDAAAAHNPFLSAAVTLPGGVPVRVHVDARGAALAVLATIAFVFALQWAQRFFIPVVFAIFIAYTLNPVVCSLERIRLSRMVAATIVMVTLFVGLFAVGATLRTEFQSIVQQLPDTTQRLSRALSKIRDDKPGAIQRMQTAANEIAKATDQATGIKSGAKQAAAEVPMIRLSEWLWAGSLGALGMLGQVVMVLFLVFFLLLSGDKFKRKLVKLTGPSLSHKKITVHLLDAMNSSIQSYMFMLLITNVLLALLMWAALRWVGLENAGAWAVASGLLHVIPYFGPLLITGATGLVAFMQFESVSTAFLVAGCSMAIATVVGTFVTTWMTGRIAKMNAAAVFIALLFWGWLWGFWGLLLGIPIVVVVKVIAEHVEGMQAFAELLGE